jgi:hypothetical protein
MNWKGFTRKQSWPNQRSIPAGTEENHETIRTISWLKYEPNASHIQVYGVTGRPTFPVTPCSLINIYQSFGGSFYQNF